MSSTKKQFFFPGAPQAVYGPPIGVVTPGQGVGGLVPPSGFVFLVDSDGAYLIDSDGYYLVEAI